MPPLIKCRSCRHFTQEFAERMKNSPYCGHLFHHLIGIPAKSTQGRRDRFQACQFGIMEWRTSGIEIFNSTYETQGTLFNLLDSPRPSLWYDVLGNLISIYDSNRGYTRYYYNVMGGIITKCYSTYTVSYFYDVLKRKIAYLDPQGNLSRYPYDGDNQLEKLDDLRY